MSLAALYFHSEILLIGVDKSIILNTINKKPMKRERRAKVNAIIEVELTEEAKLIVATLGDISPGTQASADFFNQDIPDGHPARISRQTVWSWANGEKRVAEEKLRVWKVIYPPGHKIHQLVLDIFAAREREAQVFAAHWVGSPYPKVKEEDLAEEDGKKLLKTVRVKL